VRDTLGLSPDREETQTGKAEEQKKNSPRPNRRGGFGQEKSLSERMGKWKTPKDPYAKSKKKTQKGPKFKRK